MGKKAKGMSQRDLAVLYSLPQSAISRLNRNGVDINDKDAVRTAILNQPKRPAAWVNGCPWDEKPEVSPDTDVDVDEIDMEELHRQLLTAGDYDEARFIQTKIKGLKEHLLLSIAQRTHLPRDEVMSDMRMIAASIKSAVRRLKNDLPALLEGLPAAKMKGKIDAKGDELLTLFNDLSSELYQVEGEF